ncbi:MAG: PAS domain S-box protein, partial [Alphaproteobacteria bacterium]|nr:PAS domain S-box protein [Alphaproteobacteria bacterium]
MNDGFMRLSPLQTSTSGRKRPSRNGRHIGFIGVGRDITERKHAEAALRRSETQLRLLADNMPVLIISLDADLNFRYANRAYCEIHNIEQAAILGRNVREIIGEVGYRKLKPKLDPVHKGNTLEFETTYRFADGIERDIVATYVPEIDAYGEVRGFYAMLIDITERKQAEAALRQSESQLRLLADNLPVLIMSLDTDMRFRFANRAYCNIHSIEQSDIIGRKL